MKPVHNKNRKFLELNKPVDARALCAGVFTFAENDLLNKKLTWLDVFQVPAYRDP